MTTIYSVSQINRYIKDLVRRDIFLSSVFIRGELSNLKYHPRGHLYFSLKDEGGTIQGIMFASDVRKLTSRLRDGQSVVVSGYVDVYEQGGRYQLYARDIRPEGAGELYEKFLKLKNELMESGMFDERYKRPIPKYARRIGVVTASSGAAVHDIAQIAHDRNPYVQLYLWPAQVQGKGAAASIAEGIRMLDAMGLDVLIVGRGGGSIEDLWAFNEEEVARAIFHCSTPVITGIGHETDTTIADFVADHRAKTPSDAAAAAVFRYDDFCEKTKNLQRRMRTPIDRKLHLCQERLRRYQDVLRLNRPERSLAESRARAADLEERLSAALTASVQKEKEKTVLTEQRMRTAVEERTRAEQAKCETLRIRLRDGMKIQFEQSDRRLAVMVEKLHGLSPLRRLRQGFSFTQDESGRPVRSVSDVREGDRITVFVSDGRLYGAVTGIEKENTPSEGKGRDCDSGIEIR